MLNLKCLFSSASDNWTTPSEFYLELNNEFHFDFDPCPSNPTFDGLSIEWGHCNFVNPPYGRAIVRWLEKGYSEWKYGNTVVFLVPSRTDTKWWHEYIMKADEIRFIRGRLKFSGHKNPAPFPSAIAIFKGKENVES